MRRLERVLVGARLPVPLVRQLKIEAVERETTMQDLIEQAIRDFLRRPRRET
jgi:antitoxin-like ribbon-helix-helix protein